MSVDPAANQPDPETVRGPRANQRVGNGRYELVRLLGQGGMGVVWLANDLGLGEPVALKFLPPAIRSDATALDDLRQETLKSRKLTHPHIVRIHDLFQATGEDPFISMEYVDGPALSAVRVQNPARILPWDYVSRLIKQLCEALEYAHSEKVVHRDLKPANLMLDSRTRIKLADFGIARVVTDSMSRITMRQGTSGTLVYMSPQQLDGQNSVLTDDIYSLGATLYELLTGKPPFYTGEIAHQIRYVDPEPITNRLKALQRVNDVPQHVQETILACLAKNPAQRPQTAREVAISLGLHDTKPSTSGRATVVETAGARRSAPTKTQSGTEETSRRNALVWVALAIAVGGAGFVWKDKLVAVVHAKNIATNSVPTSIPATNLAATLVPVTNSPAPTQANTTIVAKTPAPLGEELTNPIKIAPLLSSTPANNPPPAPVQKGPRPGSAWTNSLGMRFVPVSGLQPLFSVYETRVKDFAAFPSNSRDMPWTNKVYAATPEHAVAFVSYDDAKLFCDWLTRKEQREGMLRDDQLYRLPTDAEWSIAAGLPPESGKTPQEKQITSAPVFAWGPQFPPPNGFANLADQQVSKDFFQPLRPIPTYQDPFAKVAPVGSFSPSANGLFDLCGNVWEWCDTPFAQDAEVRTLRGGAWDTEDRAELSLAYRYSLGSKVRLHNIGFRCVLVAGKPPR